MHELYELKDKLCKELKEYSRMDLDAGSLNAVDTLAHAMKNLDRIIDRYEEEEYSSRPGSYMSYDNSMRGSSYAGRMGRGYRDNSYRGSRRTMRTRYSRDNDMYSDLREMMEEAPDEQTRMEFEKLIRKLEQM